MRRWRERYEEHGYDGLMDRRRGKPSSRRVPLAQVEQVLRLYQEKYFDLNVRHFHEKLNEEHGIGLSYTWVKKALPGRGWWRGRGSGAYIANGGSGGRCLEWFPKPEPTNRTSRLASNAGRLHGDRASASGRNAQHDPRTAPAATAAGYS